MILLSPFQPSIFGDSVNVNLLKPPNEQEKYWHWKVAASWPFIHGSSAYVVHKNSGGRAQPCHLGLCHMPGGMDVSRRGLVQWSIHHRVTEEQPYCCCSRGTAYFWLWIFQSNLTCWNNCDKGVFIFKASSCRSTGRHAWILGCSPRVVNNVKYFAVTSFFSVQEPVKILFFHLGWHCWHSGVSTEKAR